ncbi:LOW QUALITY PROTEIN: hypothetical protein V2J09_009653 [Rumex salicifolius]
MDEKVERTVVVWWGSEHGFFPCVYDWRATRLFPWWMRMAISWKKKEQLINMAHNYFSNMYTLKEEER